jgi:hypothetical protein
MGSKKRVFMPGNSFEEIEARLEAQPAMVCAKCGHCGGELDVFVLADSLTQPVTYDCHECELTWDSNRRPTKFFWVGAG